MNQELTILETTGELEFAQLHIDETYAKEWNESNRDFILLTKNGKPIRNTLYRVGGLTSLPTKDDDYFMLLKYVEEYYDDVITKDPKRKKHLAGYHTILDRYGNEMVVADQRYFKNPHLIKGSCVYKIINDFYNIETGEHYGNSSKYIITKNSIILELFQHPVALMINKKTGKTKIIE